MWLLLQNSGKVKAALEQQPYCALRAHGCGHVVAHRRHHQLPRQTQDIF